MRRYLPVLLSVLILTAAGLLFSASPLSVPSGTWIAAGSMYSARSGAAAVPLQGGRILITGGSDSSGPVNSAELFGSNGSFSIAAPMNVPRSGHVAVVLQDGRVLVAGGVTSGGAVTNTAEIFDPVAGTWTSVTGGMTEARSGHTAALLHDGRVLIAGGNNGTLISSTVERFDPILGGFTAVGTMSSPRTQHAMTVLQDGRALIVGGNNGTAPVASSDIFDPTNGRIGAGPSLSMARFAHSATTLLNGIVIVLGGNNGNADPAQMDVSPAELFDPTAQTPAFTKLTGNLATPREGHLALLLPNNNNLLIVGGTSGGNTVASAELFLPQESSTGVWTYAFASTGSMSTARSSATGAANQVSSPSSVMQANGALMVAGGKDASGNTLNSAELYGFATLQTDLSDYAPGTTVTITGSGWKPGETVTIQLVESPLIDMHGPYPVTADANGNIFDRSFTTDAHDANVKFTLTAIGSVSRAQMAFTDALSGTVTLNNTNAPAAAFNTSSFSKPMTVTAGGTSTVAFATVWVDEGSGASGTTFNVTATYGGQAMTSAGAAAYDYNYAPISSRVFYLVNPPTGSNTLAINATASSGTVQEIVANLVSYNGVSQTAPVRPGTYQTLHSLNSASVASFTATLTSNASDLTLGAVEATYTFATPASNQTVDGANAAYFKVGSDHATTAAASVSDTWSFTNPWAYYAYVGFSIQAANNQPALTYTATPASRVYGAGNPAFTGTVTGFTGSDNLSNSTTGALAFTTTATATSGVGSYAINGSGLSSSSYSFVQAASNATALTITQAAPTVTVTGGTYPFDGNPHAATATAVGIDGHTPVSGTFSFTYTPPGNATVPINAGTYSVTANFTSSDPNYSNVAGVSSSSPVVITPSTSATVTLNNKNTIIPSFGKSSLSAPMTVNAGGSNTVAFATVWVDEGSGAAGTTFNVTATYGGQAMTSAGATAYDYNYAPISSQVFYLVNPPTGTNTLAVNATASSGTIQEVVANLVSYNGVNQTTPVRPGTYQTLHSANNASVGAFTAAISSNTNDITLGSVEATFTFASPASNQTVDGTSAAYFKVGNDHGTTRASSISDTWSFTNTYAYYAYAGFSIQAASGTPTLTYTATPATRSYGAANPPLTGTVTGFTGTDTQANSTTGTLSFSTTATPTSNAGSYAITGSGLTASSYVFVQAAANATAFTITKATPTVTVTGGNFSYDGNSHAATATAVGTDGVTPVSGTFSFTYTPPGTSTVPINVGTYSVTANFTSTDPNYGNASGLASITIGSTALLTYTATPVSRIFGAANPAFTGAVGGFVGTDNQANSTTGTLAFSSTATASSNVGSYAINGSGLTANGGDYTFQQAPANATALTITQATPTITVTGGTFVLDGNPHAATATAVGVDGHTPVSGSFTFTYTPPGNATIPSTTGTYSVTANFTSTDPNYKNASGSASIVIATTSTLTYTANPVSRSYGAGNPPLSGTVTGFVGTDNQANATTGTLTFTTTATASSNVGSYAINGSGLTANSGLYTFAQAPANAIALSITPATPTVTVIGGAYTFDGTSHPATATAVGTDGHTPVSGSFSFTYTPPGNATVPVNVGTYSVTANFTSTNPNYSNASGTGSITIASAASATATLNNANAPVAAFNSSSFSKPMTVAAGGSNTVAFATVWVDEGSGAAGTTFNVTATYGGQAMTSAGPAAYDYNYAPISSQVFYLVNPPTGTNTLAINATASAGTIQEVAANLVSYNGVNQTTPVRPGTYQTLHSAGGTVSSFTATISSNSNDLTLGSVEATYIFASPASNQTVDGTTAAYYKVGSDHAAIGASSISDTWSFTNSYAFYAYVGFSIQAGSGPSTPTLTYTATPVSRAFGTANPAFTGTVTGFVGTDTLANSTTGTLTFTSPATISSNVGSYAINGSGLTANNGKYNFVQAASNSTALSVVPANASVYYMAPQSGGGNDANNGLTPSTPWLTPNHSVNCGDVIIAAASSAYSALSLNEGAWGNVTCPGGNNVAWLKCAVFDACKITSTALTSVWIDMPYWGIQGWEVDGSNNYGCYSAQGSPTHPVTVHHVIFANDVAIGCGAAGFGTTNLNQGKTVSADYVVIVGDIAYNDASAPNICGEGITYFQPILTDSNPGTHLFVAGNFAWNNVDAAGCYLNITEDGEGVILDTFDGTTNGLTPYAGQTVVENNILLFNGGRGLQVNHNSAATVYFKQNTVYGNNTDTHQGGLCGEILVNVDTAPTFVSGNIAATSAATTCNGSAWWDYIVSLSSTAVQVTSGIAYSPAGRTCGALNGGSFSCVPGSLLAINPNFANPVQPPAPNCTGFSGVPACMATVIANYTPQNPSAVGYGYQVPGPKAFDALFPQWLCNVNLPPGLVTLGCN